jgi:hypothetical protein
MQKFTMRDNFIRNIPRQNEHEIGRFGGEHFWRMDRNMAAGQEFSLLGGSGIADEGEEVGFDTGEVDQCIALGGGSVGGDFFSSALLLDEEGQEVVFDFFGTGLESGESESESAGRKSSGLSSGPASTTTFSS